LISKEISLSRVEIRSFEVYGNGLDAPVEVARYPVGIILEDWCPTIFAVIEGLIDRIEASTVPSIFVSAILLPSTART
jgi:hypothetical protein